MAFSNRTSARGTGALRGWSPVNPVQMPAPDLSQRRLRLIKMSDSQIDNRRTESLKINDTKYVASYNWVEKANPTIRVPGKSHLSSWQKQVAAW